MTIFLAMLLLVVWLVWVLRVVVRERDEARRERDHYASQMMMWQRRYHHLGPRDDEPQHRR